MTDSSIFSGSTEPVAPAAPSSPALNIPTEIAELVGEGKKYKSVEDALKSVPHAQQHIQTLEEENARIKAELATRRTTEDILEEIKSGVQPAQSQAAAGVQTQDVADVVTQVLAQRDAKSKAEANIDKVVSSFQSVYGDKEKAEAMYVKVAEESGLSVIALNKLAATSPDAVLKLAGITKKPETPAGKVSSSVNTEAFSHVPQGDLSAKVKMVGASTKDIKQAVQNAREIINKKYNP
jgi:hypothetical protein